MVFGKSSFEVLSAAIRLIWKDADLGNVPCIFDEGLDGAGCCGFCDKGLEGAFGGFTTLVGAPCGWVGCIMSW